MNLRYGMGMRLLIITQKVDRTDPILGFFHRWIEEFSKHCRSMTVIGQMVGEYELPSNVRVESLGKERGRSRFGQILRFWSLIWKLRGEYDVVLVHMTPIWVVLGHKIWFILRKPVYLWYEIRRGGLVLRIALLCVRKVFCATPDGLPFPSRKMIVTGHGTDTAFFTPPAGERQKGLIATVGRITPIKHLEIILDTFASLSRESQLVIAGGTITSSDKEYLRKLDRQMSRLKITPRVTIGFLSREELRTLYRRSELVLHACGGGLDKVVLEAMSCGTPVVSTSVAARTVLPPECSAQEATMTEKTKALLSMTSEQRRLLAEELRDSVKEGHDLSKLVVRLLREMSL